MNKKILIPTVAILIIIAGIGAFFILKYEQAPVHTVSPKDASDDVSPFGMHDPYIPEADKIQDVVDVGAKWVRYAGRNGLPWEFVEPKRGKFNWDYHDRLYLETYEDGVSMFVTILPSNSWDRVIDPKKPEQLPNNMEDYKLFLRNAVERYDGDGVDDAPGSPVVDVWQISNEPDIFWKGTPAEYALLLKESYKTIKQANIETDGSYSLPGVPVGEAKVAVSSDNPKSSAFQPLQREGMPPPKPLPEVKGWFPIPTEYQDLSKPKLTYTVKRGNNTYDIDLK